MDTPKKKETLKDVRARKLKQLERQEGEQPKHEETPEQKAARRQLVEAGREKMKQSRRTPLQQVRDRKLGQIESEESAANGEHETTGNAYELMLMQLAEHKQTLKGLQSIEAKIGKKLEFLPDYNAYIEGVMASDAGTQDEVLATIMVWSIDTGDFPRAIELASYLLRHDLSTPETHKRDVATLLAEEVAETTIKLEGPGDIEELMAVEELVHDKDMPDEVRAKLHKAIGLTLQESDKPKALEHLQRAKQLHNKAGVTKLIEKLQRDIKNAQS